MNLKTAHRIDIQSLRGIAVLLVVLGHLFPTVIKGGFIGVDIFFVISGFVITQQIQGIYEKSGSQLLITFYSRRIRRILPLALLVITSTVFATKYFLGPVTGNQVKIEGGWASIFLSNFYFARTATDYFASGIEASPLQNMWSLSIEEQFYLVWPTLFLLLMTRFISKKIRYALILIILLLSLSSSIYQSVMLNSPIFFSTQTRIWELVSGVLLAFLYRGIAYPRIVLNLSTTLLIVSAMALNQSMQWPNLAAIPIVFFTLLILSTSPLSPHKSILQNSILRYVGDISYCWYLWHWPILMITKGYLPFFEIKNAFLVLISSLILSIISHHFFEKPIRYSKLMQRNPGAIFFFALFLLSLISYFLFTSYQS